MDPWRGDTSGYTLGEDEGSARMRVSPTGTHSKTPPCKPTPATGPPRAVGIKDGDDESTVMGVARQLQLLEGPLSPSEG